jgi:hypothetical protein
MRACLYGGLWRSLALFDLSFFAAPGQKLCFPLPARRAGRILQFIINAFATKMILPCENHPWTWDCKPTVMIAASGSKEIIGGGALTNVITYRWNDVIFTYANYIGVFRGRHLSRRRRAI